MGCQSAESTHLFNHQLQTLCRSIRWNAEYLQGSVGSMQELILRSGPEGKVSPAREFRTESRLHPRNEPGLWVGASAAWGVGLGKNLDTKF